MSKVSLVVCALAVASSLAACKEDAKPAPSTTPSAATTAAASTAAVASAAPTPKAAAVKPDKAHKKSLPAAALVHPIPADWTELSDDVRGFSFSVPAGTQGHGEDKHGVGVFLAVLPKPHDKVASLVVAYKDAKKTADDLEKQSEELIAKVMEETNVKKVGAKDISEDYRLVELTSEDSKHVKAHWKALLATDVTDNYIMIVGTPETEYKANEPTIDEMWGSFDMFSGGASGESK